MKARVSILLLCASGLLTGATANGRIVPQPGSVDHETAKRYFVKWAAPTFETLPVHICDWKPERKIAALEVPRAALFTTTREWVMLIERKGVRKEIRMQSLGKAANPAEQAELTRVATYCADRAADLKD